MPSPSVIGLSKAEVIQRRGPWRHLEAVERAHPNLGGLVQHPAAACPSGLCAGGGVQKRYYEQAKVA